MKHIILIFCLVFLVLSCDKIKHPDPQEGISKDCRQTAPILKNNYTTSGTKKVLLEDYTGHFCGNCPPAAVNAENLVAKYPGRVIVLANHVSKTYAAPKTDELWKEDFRNTASTEWDVELGMSASGLPKGSINRLKSPTYPQNISNWSSLVAQEIAKAQTVKLDVSTSYDPSKKLLNANVKATFKTAYSKNVKVCFVIVQDSIISDQADYNPPVGVELDPNDKHRRIGYRFDHMVVGSLNGTWGNVLKEAPIAANDIASFSTNCNLIGKCFFKDVVCTNDDKMALVVFAYNEDTKEVLQVEKIKFN